MSLWCDLLAHRIRCGTCHPLHQFNAAGNRRFIEDTGSTGSDPELHFQVSHLGSTREMLTKGFHSRVCGSIKTHTHSLVVGASRADPTGSEAFLPPARAATVVVTALLHLNASATWHERPISIRRPTPRGAGARFVHQHIFTPAHVSRQYFTSSRPHRMHGPEPVSNRPPTPYRVDVPPGILPR